VLLEQILVRILQLFAPRDHNFFQRKIAYFDQIQNARTCDSCSPDVERFKRFWRANKGKNAFIADIYAAE